MSAFCSTLERSLIACAAALAFCATGPFTALGQDGKKPEKTEIPGGIEGHIKSVDHEKETVSIIVSTGKERTFKVTEDTTMVGPRGGKVRRRLRDKRFHEGMELTIVADGTNAAEIHLGFSHKDTGDTADSKTESKTKAPETPSSVEEPRPGPRKKRIAAKIEKAAKAAAEDDDDDDEVPGKVKSFDPARRMLVVALLNGKNRSFLLANDVKVVVKGKTSTEGLKDSALKDGAVINVITEPGGRRVKELQITPASSRTKKAA